MNKLIDQKKEEYIPFGEKWKNELMKLPKIGIIALYRSLCLKEQERESHPNSEAVIEKYKELTKALSDQDALFCGEAFKDPEGYGYKALSISQRITKLESELSSLQQQESEPEESVNFMQIRDLTDEEWLKLPKEEILQLYKSCYKILMASIALSGEKISEVKTITGTIYNADIPVKEPLPSDEDIEKYANYWFLGLIQNGKTHYELSREQITSFLADFAKEMRDGKIKQNGQ